MNQTSVPTSGVSRRAFLRKLVAGAVFTSGVLGRGSIRAGTSNGKTLVVIFQRGANDGLNTVVPYADPDYYALRPGIGIAPPGSPDGAGLDLAGTGFALHPSLAPLLGLWNGGELAIMTTAGAAGSSRSHFTQQDTIERGLFQLADGWLNRYLQATEPAAPVGARAAAMGPKLTKALRGSVTVPAIDSLSGSTFAGLGTSRARLDANAAAIWGQAPQRTSDNPYRRRVHDLGPQMRGYVRRIEALGPATPQNGALYPATAYGRQLADLAHLIRSGVGLEAATVDIGGWDTHHGQGSAGAGIGLQGRRLDELARGIRAFRDDLGPKMADVVLFTCTEFGRTAKENASGGTDHGRASTWFCLGGAVRGGLYHGGAGWPGLSAANLDEGRYLMPQIDYRDIFSEVLSGHLGVGAVDLDRVLPGHVRQPIGMI